MKKVLIIGLLAISTFAFSASVLPELPDKFPMETVLVDSMKIECSFTLTQIESNDFVFDKSFVDSHFGKNVFFKKNIVAQQFLFLPVDVGIMTKKHIYNYNKVYAAASNTTKTYSGIKEKNTHTV